MCPACMTTAAALVAAGTTSGAGVLCFVAVKFRWLRRLRHHTISKQIQEEAMSASVAVSPHKIVSQDEWLPTRRNLLNEEKQLTKQQQRIAAGAAANCRG